jgi:rare lipoprotein A
MASWYGPDFQGKPTSSKEIYDMFDMTAAHQTLPFGTYVMVTNLNNNKAVTVRINDRGPFVKERIIDLSYAAAKVLDMVGPGVAPVSVEVLKDMSPKQSVVKYSVQVGSFSDKANAVDLKQKLGNRYGNVVITEFKTARQIYYRVRIKAKTRTEAEAIAEKLSKNGYTVIIFEEQ